MRVWLQKDGMLCARALCGSRVFVAQGPPLTLQIEREPERLPLCVGNEVELAMRFASTQAKRGRHGG